MVDAPTLDTSLEARRERRKAGCGRRRDDGGMSEADRSTIKLATLVQGVLGTVIAALLIWMGTQVAHLSAAMERMDERVKAQAVSVDNAERIAKLERETIRLKTQSEVESALRRLDLIRTDVTQLQESIRQVWPRLRAMGENQQLLYSELQRQHPGISWKLKEPEAF